MTDSRYDGNRKGSITKEKAVETFNKYYENRANSAIGRFRAKLFDMMYQKKPSKTLTPGEPGSERYLLEEGPRTFDMKGVDSFEEDTEFIIHGEDNTTKYKSKGSTYKKSTDNEDAEVYGPRLNNDDKTLYSSHFKEVYQDRAFLEEDEKGSLNGKSLVEIYWEKYADGGIKRKNLKLTKQQNFAFIGFTDEKITYILDLNDKIIYDESGIILSEVDTENQLNFLIKLNLLNIKDNDYVLDKKFSSAKFLKIVTKIEEMNDTFYYRLEDGVSVNQECNEGKNFVSLYRLMELLDYELEDIISVDIHNCSEDKSNAEDILEPKINLFESTIESEIKSNLQNNLDENEEQLEEEDDEEDDEEDYEGEDDEEEVVEEEDDEEEVVEEEDDEEEVVEEEDNEEEVVEEEDDEEEVVEEEDDEEEVAEEEDDEEEVVEEDSGEEDESMIGLDEELSILDSLELETDDEKEDGEVEDEGTTIQLSNYQQDIFDKLSINMRNEPGLLKEMARLELE